MDAAAYEEHCKIRAALVAWMRQGPGPAAFFPPARCSLRCKELPYAIHSPYVGRSAGNALSVVVFTCATLMTFLRTSPPEMRPKHFDLPQGAERIRRVASGTTSRTWPTPYVSPAVSFLGAGFYDPLRVPRSARGRPFRPQRVLYLLHGPIRPNARRAPCRRIFEYQTAVSPRLLDMDCRQCLRLMTAARPCFEACMMAVRATRRKKLEVDQCINPPSWAGHAERPNSSSLDITLVTVPSQGRPERHGRPQGRRGTPTCAAVLVQNPNFFGAVADFSELFAHARACKALGVISVYPVMSVPCSRPPARWAPDIACGRRPRAWASP